MCVAAKLSILRKSTAKHRSRLSYRRAHLFHSYPFKDERRFTARELHIKTASSPVVQNGVITARRDFTPVEVESSDELRLAETERKRVRESMCTAISVAYIEIKRL